MPHEIVMRHRTPQFAHVFAGDGYSAGYYSYLWAETPGRRRATRRSPRRAAPTTRPWRSACAETVFSVGNTVDPAEAYRAFRGRDPNPAALMR